MVTASHTTKPGDDLRAGPSEDDFGRFGDAFFPLRRLGGGGGGGGAFFCDLDFDLSVDFSGIGEDGTGGGGGGGFRMLVRGDFGFEGGLENDLEDDGDEVSCGFVVGACTPTLRDRSSADALASADGDLDGSVDNGVEGGVDGLADEDVEFGLQEQDRMQRRRQREIWRTYGSGFVPPSVSLSAGASAAAESS